MPRPLFLGLLLLTVLRMVVANASELTPPEAELWLAARHPAAGYFSAGPWPVWMTWLGTHLAGDGPAGVRLFAPWLMLAASWLAWRLTLAMFGSAAAMWLVAILQLVPLVNVAAVRAVPGAWAFGWGVLALWWWWQALHRASRWAWQWPASGVAMGLAALSDAAGWWLAPGLLCLLALPRRWRKQLARPGPWLAWGVMLLVLSPWLVWQHGVHWLPWRTHWLGLTRGLEFAPFAKWLGHIVLALSPLLLAGVVWAAWRGVEEGVQSWRRRWQGGLGADDPLGQKDGRVFLLASMVPAAVGAVIFAFMGQGALTLVALPAFATLAFLVAWWVVSPLSPVLRRLTQNATLILAAAYALVSLHPDLLRHIGLRWPYRWDPLADAVGWSALAQHLERRADALRPMTETAASAETPAPAPFCLAGSPALAAQVCYVGRAWLVQAAEAPVFFTDGLICQPLATAAVDNDFAFWPRYTAPEKAALFAGRDALFLHDRELTPEQRNRLQGQFEQVEDGGWIELRRGGLPVRRLSCFIARRFRGASPP